MILNYHSNPYDVQPNNSLLLATDDKWDRWVCCNYQITLNGCNQR